MDIGIFKRITNKKKILLMSTFQINILKQINMRIYPKNNNIKINLIQKMKLMKMKIKN